jgi:hypothetical protein
MGLPRLPVRAFWRHPWVSSSDCASCLEGGLDKGWVHRAEGQFFPVPSYGLREAPAPKRPRKASKESNNFSVPVSWNIRLPDTG